MVLQYVHMLNPCTWPRPGTAPGGRRADGQGWTLKAEEQRRGQRQRLEATGCEAGEGISRSDATVYVGRTRGATSSSAGIYSTLYSTIGGEADLGGTATREGTLLRTIWNVRYEHSHHVNCNIYLFRIYKFLITVLWKEIFWLKVFLVRYSSFG